MRILLLVHTPSSAHRWIMHCSTLLEYNIRVKYHTHQGVGPGHPGVGLAFGQLPHHTPQVSLLRLARISKERQERSMASVREQERRMRWSFKYEVKYQKTLPIARKATLSIKKKTCKYSLKVWSRWDLGGKIYQGVIQGSIRQCT